MDEVQYLSNFWMKWNESIHGICETSSENQYWIIYRVIGVLRMWVCAWMKEKEIMKKKPNKYA